jgi:predicted nucleotidyltransferase
MGEKADSKIRDFVKEVKAGYRVDKAILFGSRARGDHFKDSDYDIILVSPDFKGVFFTERIARVYDFWKHYPAEIEPLCYTPEEFKTKSKEHGIVKAAIKEGIEIL